MSFFGEIASVLGLDEAKLALGYNYINYNGNALYVEGVKSVLRLDSDEMAFKLPKGVLYVFGNKLAISDLSGASVLICGEIISVTTERDSAKRGKKENTKEDANRSEDGGK